MAHCHHIKHTTKQHLINMKVKITCRYFCCSVVGRVVREGCRHLVDHNCQCVPVLNGVGNYDHDDYDNEDSGDQMIAMILILMKKVNICCF